MDARLIQFHITPKLEGQTQEELRQTPSGFNMEFIAKEKYISENLQGVPQFRREYRHSLNHVIDQFNEYYQWHTEKAAKMKHYGDSFGRLEDLSDATKYLASLLKSEFLVPNELELIDIQIVGQFSVYESGGDTDLKKQADQIREASIREIQKKMAARQPAPNQPGQPGRPVAMHFPNREPRA